MQPTHQSIKTNPIQPNWLGQFLGIYGLGWVVKMFFATDWVEFG